MVPDRDAGPPSCGFRVVRAVQPARRRGAVQLSSEGGAHVFVVEEDKQGQGQGATSRRKPVTIGIDGGNWLEIVSGLSGTERVVIGGIDALADGMKVRVAAPSRQGT